MTQITTSAFAAKFRSKREVFRFLSNEVGAYLSSYETMTVWHLKDLAANNRRIIKCTAVKVMDVPQYEGLAIEKILMWAINWHQGHIMLSFPREKHEIL